MKAELYAEMHASKMYVFVIWEYAKHTPGATITHTFHSSTASTVLLIAPTTSDPFFLHMLGPTLLQCTVIVPLYL